jgi:hypothetical protein
MRICYVANHAQVASNDDEGAICFALRQLGHEVVCIPERNRRYFYLPNGNLLLFHKWCDEEAIRTFSGAKACFFFDLIDWKSDRTLGRRCAARRDLISRITRLADVVFMTDGDHVAQDTTGKLVWLPQGADERFVGHSPAATQDMDILFTGIAKGGGVRRESFVREMRERYSERFVHVERGVHGMALRELVGRAKVVVCPDSPVTDRYWSNRLVLMLGFGAFLLHPHSEGAMALYRGAQAVWYRDREQLHKLISVWIGDPEGRNAVAQAGLARTLAEHTYRHRCERMLAALRERGLIP